MIAVIFLFLDVQSTVTIAHGHSPDHSFYFNLAMQFMHVLATLHAVPSFTMPYIKVLIINTIIDAIVLVVNAISCMLMAGPEIAATMLQIQIPYHQSMRLLMSTCWWCMPSHACQ